MSYFEDPRLLGDGSAWSIYQALSQFISQFKLIDFTGLMLFVQCYDRGGPMYSAARHIVSEFEFHFALIPDDMGSMMAAMRFFPFIIGCAIHGMSNSLYWCMKPLFRDEGEDVALLKHIMHSLRESMHCMMTHIHILTARLRFRQPRWG